MKTPVGLYIKVTVVLTRPARKSGGDRYEGSFDSGEDFTIYVPQSLSRRTDGTPVNSITITFESE